MSILSSTDIPAVAAEIAVSRGKLEHAFVTIGSSLMQSAGLLNRITQTFDALPQDLASTELTEATARLASVGERAREISASFAAEQSDIARLVEVVDSAREPIFDLARAVKMIGIVAINARVAAASIGGNGGDVAVFTVDIADLAAAAAKTIQDFSGVYGRLSQEVQRASQQRAQFEAAHSQTLVGLAERLGDNLTQLVTRREASVASSAQTGRVSRQIAGRIAAAVMAMQVGDATRQRLEHVEAALAALAGLLETPGEASTACLGEVARLQSAQLAGTGETFESEIAEVDSALRRLAGDARNVMAESRQLYGEAGAGTQSSLAVFSGEISQAVAVLRDCEAERAKLEQVADAVLETVTVLMQHVDAVRKIEASMRLVSINAAVRCAQLGTRGRALNVIATQLRELTGETVLAADAAMHSLDRAVELARSFGAASIGAGAGDVAWLEREVSGALDLMQAVDGRLGDALRFLDTEGTAAVRHLEAAVAALSGHGATSKMIASTRHTLEAVAATGPVETIALDFLAKLRASYTMEPERRIHDSLVATGSAIAA